MEDRLRQLYTRISTRCPALGVLLRRLYLRKPFNTIKRDIHGSDNRILHRDAILASVLLDIAGDHNTIEIRANCLLNKVSFHIRGDGHKVLIGSGCRFNRGGSIWMEDQDGQLVVGENSTFEDVHLAVTEPRARIAIGKDCMFAYDIDVRTGDSHAIFSQESHQRINYAEDVVIGDHVWVGAHSIILKGCHIPDDSIVATGSVVTKKYETPGVIIGGNPAREIRRGVTWSRERS